MKMKASVILVMFAVFVSIGCKGGEKTDDGEPRLTKSELRALVVERYPMSDADSALEAARQCVHDRALGNEMKPYETRDTFIELIARYLDDDANDNAIKALLLLFQYGGAADSEYIAELLTPIFYASPKRVINANAWAATNYRAAFQNEAFIRSAILGSCGYPPEVYDAPSFDQSVMDAVMRETVTALATPENQFVIDVLVNSLFTN